MVLVGGDLPAKNTASTLAHELWHALRYLMGKPWKHEMGMFETSSPGVFSVYDPSGPVNQETLAAGVEAEANHDPFISQF